MGEQKLESRKGGSRRWRRPEKKGLRQPAGSFIGTAGSPAAVISNAETVGFSLLGTAGLATGSVFTSVSAVNAATSVGTASSLPTFTYFGTSSAAALPSAFIAGVLSTGALPTSSLALTTTGLTLWTSGGCIQPWFCLVGQ
jgi:hypothetical protein